MAIPRFWREIPSRYNFIATRCENCQRISFPPRTLCPICHRLSIGKMKRIRLKGEGSVVSYSVIYDAPKQFEMQIPYILAIVNLDEGVNVTGQIIDCEPENMEIGMRVKAAFRKLSEDDKNGVIYYGYKFRQNE